MVGGRAGDGGGSSLKVFTGSAATPPLDVDSGFYVQVQQEPSHIYVKDSLLKSGEWDGTFSTGTTGSPTPQRQVTQCTYNGYLWRLHGINYSGSTYMRFCLTRENPATGTYKRYISPDTAEASGGITAQYASDLVYGIYNGTLRIRGIYYNSNTWDKSWDFALNDTTNTLDLIAYSASGETKYIYECAAITVDGRYLYISGGQRIAGGSSQASQKTFFMMDLSAGGPLVTLPDLPAARSAHGMAQVGRKLYVIGGNGAVRTIYAWDLDAQIWSTLSTTLPSAGFSMGNVIAAAYGTKVIIASKYASGYSSVYIWDTITNVFTKLQNNPMPSTPQILNVVGNYAYAYTSATAAQDAWYRLRITGEDLADGDVAIQEDFSGSPATLYEDAAMTLTIGAKGAFQRVAGETVSVPMWYKPSGGSWIGPV
jgi:hypothetical protein